MEKVILTLCVGYAYFSFVDSWSCQSSIERVYSRPNSSATIHFDISYMLPSSVTFDIANSTGFLLAIVLYAHGEVYTDTLSGVNVTANGAGHVQMTIYNQTFLNPGTYRISSGLSSSVMCSCLFLLGIPTKPSISTGQVPSVGESVTLTCFSTSTTTPGNHSLNMSYDWIVNGVQNPIDTRFSYSASRNTLTLMYVVKDDSNKQFACTATENVLNGYQSFMSESTSVIVSYGPESMRLNPGYTNVEKVENTFLPAVVCEADCYPACRFRWTKLDSGIVVTRTASLQLESVTRQAAGTYRCTATRSVSESATKDFKLEVLYAPKVSIRVFPAAVTLNQDFKIFCEANDGVPALYHYKGLIHTYNGQIIQTTSPAVYGTPPNTTLHILSAHLPDTGTYTCYANNGVNNTGALDQTASIDMDVRAHPLIIMEKATFFGKVSETLSINVPFHSYPSTNNITITRNDGLSVITNYRYILTYETLGVETLFYHTKVVLNATVLKFLINNLTNEDFTKYVILVSNEVGYNSVEITVVEKGQPVSPTDFKVSIFSGVLILSWDSNSNGGEDQSFLIQTLKEGADQWSNQTLIKESDKHHLISEGRYIVNLTGLPSGVYKCRIIAVNSLGAAEPVYLSGHLEVSQIQKDAYANDSTLTVGLVLGILNLGLVLSVTILIVKIRSLRVAKEAQWAEKSSNYENQRTLYTNVAFQHATDQQTESSRHASQSADGQYSTLDNKLRDDTRTYDAINTAT